MVARIYKPTKTAMQSGKAHLQDWVLDFEPEAARFVEPLMGWTSTVETKQQVRLRFATLEEAVAYCDRHAIPYQVLPLHEPARRIMSYSDNFAYGRRVPWTH